MTVIHQVYACIRRPSLGKNIRSMLFTPLRRTSTTCKLGTVLREWMEYCIEFTKTGFEF